MAMNEDYVSYELAKKLKECGFADPCDHYYIKDNAPDGTAWIVPTTYREDFNADSYFPFCKPLCSAPTLAHAQKWLREVKGLHIAITWGYSFQWLWFGLHITKFPKGDEFEKGNFGYSTYEQALFAGISASLELIKNGE